MIRSHKKFPWNYALCEEATTYSLSFSTAENLIGKFKVVLQIVSVDLDSKYDSLSLKNKDRSFDIKEGSKIVMPITNLDYVRLEFTSFRPRNRMGCLTSAYKGFLFCMKRKFTHSLKKLWNFLIILGFFLIVVCNCICIFWSNECILIAVFSCGKHTAACREDLWRGDG